MRSSRRARILQALKRTLAHPLAWPILIVAIVATIEGRPSTQGTTRTYFLSPDTTGGWKTDLTGADWQGPGPFIMVSKINVRGGTGGLWSWVYSFHEDSVAFLDADTSADPPNSFVERLSMLQSIQQADPSAFVSPQSPQPLTSYAAGGTARTYAIRWQGVVREVFALTLLGLFLASVYYNVIRWKESRLLAAKKCPSCGYPTTGLPSATCPECGTTLNS